MSQSGRRSTISLALSRALMPSKLGSAGLGGIVPFGGLESIGGDRCCSVVKPGGGYGCSPGRKVGCDVRGSAEVVGITNAPLVDGSAGERLGGP